MVVGGDRLHRLQVAALEGMATRQRDLMGGGGGAGYANGGGGSSSGNGATREGVWATAETLHTLHAQLQGGASSTARRTAALAAAARLRSHASSPAPPSSMRVSEQSLEGMQSLLAQQNEALQSLMEVLKADLRDLAVLESPDGGGPRGSNGALLVL
jgi:hypothetical protein